MSGVNIAMMMGGKRVQLFNRSYTKFSVSPADAYAAVKYGSDGNIYKCEAESLTYVDTTDDWLLSGSAGDYWIRCTYTGDAPTTGSATSTWLQLSTERSWGVHVTGISGYKFSTLTIEIAADSGGSNVLATATVTVEAETTP